MKLDMTTTPSTLLSREEAARYLGVSVSALAAWACNKRYELKMIKVGRLVKYRIQDLEDFLNRNTVRREAA